MLIKIFYSIWRDSPLVPASQASKVTHNDPRPTPPPEYYLRLENNGGIGELDGDVTTNSVDSGDTGGETDCDLDDISVEVGASELSEDDIFAEFKWLEQIDGIVTTDSLTPK